jgi:hypothetical protein
MACLIRRHGALTAGISAAKAQNGVSGWHLVDSMMEPGFGMSGRFHGRSGCPSGCGKALQRALSHSGGGRKADFRLSLQALLRLFGQSFRTWRRKEVMAGTAGTAA